jgi:hypothetical protein
MPAVGAAAEVDVLALVGAAAGAVVAGAGWLGS